jgi:hypothetical protein
MEDDQSRVQWRKSSYSGNTGNCVEVANLSKEIAVKDSRDQSGPELSFEYDQWRFFTNFIKHVYRS